MNVSLGTGRLCLCAVIGAAATTALAAPCDEKPKASKTVAVADVTTGKNVQTINVRYLDGRAVLELVEVGEKPMVLTADSIVISDAVGEASSLLTVNADGRVVLTAAPKDPPRVQIGLTTESLPEPLAAQLSLAPTRALLVSDVVKGLAADKAGLRKYDVIASVGEAPDVTQDLLVKKVQACQPGDPVRMRVIRQGEPIDLTVTAEPYRATIKAAPIVSEIPVIAELFTTDAGATEQVLLRQRNVMAPSSITRRVDTLAVVEYKDEAAVRAELAESLARLKKQIEEIETLLEMMKD